MRCPRCQLVVARCVCAEIPTVATQTRVLIVRHMLERWKPSNTARLAALALPSCTMVDYGVQGGELPTVEEGAWLLYPGGQTPPGRPTQLVVLDGTWPQARRMAQKIPALRGLPRMSFPTRPDIERMRRPPIAEGMATLEAIARALERLEGAEVARPLDLLFAEVVRRSRLVWPLPSRG